MHLLGAEILIAFLWSSADLIFDVLMSKTVGTGAM
jgi:hypothetical protein